MRQPNDGVQGRLRAIFQEEWMCGLRPEELSQCWEAAMTVKRVPE